MKVTSAKPRPTELTIVNAKGSEKRKLLFQATLKLVIAGVSINQ